MPCSDKLRFRPGTDLAHALDLARTALLLTFLAAPLAACGGGGAPAPTEPAGESASPAAGSGASAPAGETAAGETGDKAAAGETASGPSCEAAPSFRYELIELPPQFAPSLPAGKEELFFHPGMFDTSSDGYFSYVFKMEFSEGAARDKDQLQALLTAYFRGLVEAVGKEKGADYNLDAVTVRLVPVKRVGEYFGSVELFDAFGSGRPVQLKTKIWQTGNCLRAALSPQTLDAPMWSELASALDCVPCGE